MDELAELEDELTESVRDIAREVQEDVRDTVRSLREELTHAAREMRKQGPVGATQNLKDTTQRQKEEWRRQKDYWKDQKRVWKEEWRHTWEDAWATAACCAGSSRRYARLRRVAWTTSSSRVRVSCSPRRPSASGRRSSTPTTGRQGSSGAVTA
jgi:hypothetical protein